MKRWPIIIMCIFSGSVLAAIPVLESSTGKAGTGGSIKITTSAIDCHLSNLTTIFVADFDHDCSLDISSDSLANVYTLAAGTNNTAKSQINGCLFYSTSPVVSSAMTFSINGNFSSMEAACFQNVQPRFAINASSASYFNSATITPTLANTLILCGDATVDTVLGNYTAANFNVTNSVLFVSGTNEGSALAYLSTTTASSTCLWSTKNSSSSVTEVAFPGTPTCMGVLGSGIICGSQQ